MNAIAAKHGRDHAEVFWLTIDGLLDVKSRSPVSAQQFDETARSRRLTPSDIEFQADVEKAVQRAIQPRLYKVFWQLVISRLKEQDAPDTADARTVIQRCGREFQRRGLKPGLYFRKVRRKRG